MVTWPTSHAMPSQRDSISLRAAALRPRRRRAIEQRATPAAPTSSGRRAALATPRAAVRVAALRAQRWRRQREQRAEDRQHDRERIDRRRRLAIDGRSNGALPSAAISIVSRHRRPRRDDDAQPPRAGASAPRAREHARELVGRAASSTPSASTARERLGLDDRTVDRDAGPRGSPRSRRAAATSSRAAPRPRPARRSATRRATSAIAARAARREPAQLEHRCRR